MTAGSVPRGRIISLACHLPPSRVKDQAGGVGQAGKARRIDGSIHRQPIELLQSGSDPNVPHINNPGTAPDTTQGGVLDFYWWDNNNQNISSPFSAADLARRGQGGSRSGNAEGAYQGVSCAANNNAGCYFLARFDFTSGADVNSQVNTMISPAGTQNFSSYLSVDSGVMGYWSAALDSDFFTLNPNNQRCGDPGVSCVSANDMRTAGDFTRLGAENWDIANTDIIGLGKTGTSTAFVVPEPTSLILLGLGVALIGVSRTERRARR